VEKNKIDYGNEELNNALVIRIKKDYTLYGKARSIDITLLVFNFVITRNEGEDVETGDVIGKQLSEGQKYIIVSESIDDYYVLMSTSLPVYYKGKYWFNPSFLFNGGSMAYLDYQYVDIEEALTNVAVDANEGGPGYVFYPNYRVRFLIKLSEYPEILTSKQQKSISGYEGRLYGKIGIDESYNEIIIGEYRYLIIWQKGFKEYLANEYELGRDIWIYAAIATYDVWQNEGYVFVRDFFLESPEMILERHYKALVGNGT
jgi:hypothetical protein